MTHPQKNDVIRVAVKRRFMYYLELSFTQICLQQKNSVTFESVGKNEIFKDLVNGWLNLQIFTLTEDEYKDQKGRMINRCTLTRKI